MFPSSVTRLLSELSALPYENLSKIVARHEGRVSGKTPEGILSFSDSWLEDHANTGLGGTCFALTHWLKRRMEALGFPAAYLMADKPAPAWMSAKQGAGRVEANVHCGLLFEHAGRSWLLDPGYLIFEPLALPAAGIAAEVFLPPNRVRLEDAGSAWRLWTGPRAGELKRRFDFRKEPVDATEFQRHWEASYDWPMMRYPVLNRVKDGTQYYLQKSNLLVRTADASDMRKLSPAELRDAAVNLFGLPRGLVEEALGILEGTAYG